MNKSKKRTYTKKLQAALRFQKNFLLEQLREEWEKTEKTAKKEKIVRQAKEGGIMIGKTILILAAIAGFLAVSMVAPNIFGAIGNMSKKKKFFNKKDFQEATKYLKRKKFIHMEKTDNFYRIELTETGADIILSHSFNQLRIQPEKKWDGVWRIIIFDIPDRHKWARNVFHERLKAIGFYQLQKSVFIIPYPCDKELGVLVSILNIRDYIRLIKTREIINDDDLKEHYSL